MKVTATDTVGALGTITLGDESASDVIVDSPVMLEEVRQIQSENLAFATRGFAVGRGNAQTNFSWTVERQHASQTAALTFQLTHAPLVPVNCSVAVYTDDGTEHNFTSAVITRVKIVEWSNIRTRATYTVEGAIPDPAHL